MKVKIDRDIRPIISEIEAYYAGEGYPEAGNRKVKAILAAISNLAQRRIGHHIDNNLPREYRRRNVEGYATFTWRSLTTYSFMMCVTVGRSR